MKITECLGIEHRIFLRQIDRLEEAQRLNAPPAEQRTMMALLADVLEEHASIEDELLFPALEPHIGRRSGPLAVMDMEHQELRALLSRAQTDGDSLATVVSYFVAIARDHFAKEDQILFPLAEQILGEERLVELGHTCPHVQPQRA